VPGPSRACHCQVTWRPRCRVEGRGSDPLSPTEVVAAAMIATCHAGATTRSQPTNRQPPTHRRVHPTRQGHLTCQPSHQPGRRGQRPAPCKGRRRLPAGRAAGNASPGRPLAHVLTGGVLARSIACPVPRPPGPGCAAPGPDHPTTAPARAAGGQPAVSSAGDHGRRAEDPGRLPHARKTAQVTVEADTYQITVDPASPSPRPHHQPRHQAA
jgi:hypothetical protein